MPFALLQDLQSRKNLKSLSILTRNISRFVFPLFDKGRSATFDTVLFFFIHYLHFIKAHRKEYHTFIDRNLTLILFAIIFYEYESEYEGIYHCYSI